MARVHCCSKTTVEIRFAQSFGTVSNKTYSAASVHRGRGTYTTYSRWRRIIYMRRYNHSILYACARGCFEMIIERKIEIRPSHVVHVKSPRQPGVRTIIRKKKPERNLSGVKFYKFSTRHAPQPRCFRQLMVRRVKSVVRDARDVFRLTIKKKGKFGIVNHFTSSNFIFLFTY